VAVIVEQDVRRLDIAVDEAATMGGIECVRDLRQHPHRFPGGAVRYGRFAP
jgi:hypothetical protein